MSWRNLTAANKGRVDGNSFRMAVIKGSKTVVRLSTDALVRTGWSKGEKIAVYLGEGEDAGWIRLVKATSPKEGGWRLCPSGGACRTLRLSLAPSVLGDRPSLSSVEVEHRYVENDTAIEVKLPWSGEKAADRKAMTDVPKAPPLRAQQTEEPIEVLEYGPACLVVTKYHTHGLKAAIALRDDMIAQGLPYDAFQRSISALLTEAEKEAIASDAAKLWPDTQDIPPPSNVRPVADDKIAETFVATAGKTSPAPANTPPLDAKPAAKPPIETSIDNVVTYLRRQDNVVIRGKKAGTWLYNSRETLTDEQLIAKANRTAKRRGDAEMIVTLT